MADLTGRTRIFLADDHAVLRAGLRVLIERTPDLVVVGEAGTGTDVARGVLENPVDVLVLDLAMPGGGGLRALREVVALSPTTRIVVLSMYDDRGFLRAAFDAGARGYVAKKSADTDLLNAIRVVMAGGVYVDPCLAPDADLADEAAPGVSTASGVPRPTPVDGGGLGALSPREREVFDLLGGGHTNREIAKRIGVGIKTIETYRARVLRKLGFKTRAELVGYAVANGLVRDDKNA